MSLRFSWTRERRNSRPVVTVHDGDAVRLVERFDIFDPEARKKFAAATVNGTPGIDVADAETALLNLAAEMADGGEDEPAQDDQPEPDRLAAMPESIRNEARAMLESPDLLKRVVEDVAALGVAGERELAATLYVVGTSRLLPKPLAAIVQGPTSSGKS